MPSEVKHSPTPWTTDGLLIFDIKGDGHIVSAIASADRSLQEQCSNAALIVKCVNAHDELLDLVALCLPYMEDAQKDPAYKKGTVAPLVKRIRDAITAAEGKK